MAKETVEVSSVAIKKVLDKFSPEQAIAEYVWNGFDAGADCVEIVFTQDSDEFDTFKEVIVKDNGSGINHEELNEKFKRFFESNKSKVAKNPASLVMGKNGYGRFTFHKFSNNAVWYTNYEKDKEIFSYSIEIESENLKDYAPSKPEITDSETGTSVIFTEVDVCISTKFINDILTPYLCAEFAWFLELKENYQLIVNGNTIDYKSIIAESESIPFEIEDNNNKYGFQCKYIRWTRKLNDEYSRFYFLNEDHELKDTATTTLNKKGDNFWHSMIVIGDLFDNALTFVEEPEDKQKPKLFDEVSDRKAYKKLVKVLNDFLKKKRKPFLREQAEVLVEKYEKEKVLPDFGDNEWDLKRKESLESLVKEMYEVEPSIFLRLNKEQKRIFLSLLNLIMDSSERESLFKIIDSVVELDSDDRDEFAKILENTKLKYIISTINIISNRLLMVESLKKIVFEHDLKANERDHLQKFIDKHYWIFGEEYRMVCSEEVKFEKALQKYLYVLRGIDEKTFLAHPDKYREMDLFLCGTDFRDGKPHNVIVEIKNPSTIKKLKSKEVTQIKEYIDVILSEDQFNDNNEYWSFYLIGQDFDNIVKEDIQDIEKGILRKHDNYCLYVRKWSEIVNEVERRLKYLLEKLKLEREYLSKQSDLDEIMESVKNTEV